MVQNLLEASGIPTFLKNENAAGMTGAELGALVFAWPEVWIKDDNDLQKAVECIKQSAFDFLKRNETVEDELDDNDSVWSCPDCKEEVPSSFDVCWNCGGDEPESPEEGA